MVIAATGAAKEVTVEVTKIQSDEFSGAPGTHEVTAERSDLTPRPGYLFTELKGRWVFDVVDADGKAQRYVLARTVKSEGEDGEISRWIAVAVNPYAPVQKITIWND